MCTQLVLIFWKKMAGGAGRYGARYIRPKFPEIPAGWKSNGTESFLKSFRKFRSTSRGYQFLWNLEIPEISCSIWHFYPVWICPSSFSREKLQDGSESFESTLHWMQNNLPQFEPVLDCLFSTLGSDFLENCGLVVPNFLRFSSLCFGMLPGHTFPREKFASCSHHAKMVFESVR